MAGLAPGGPGEDERPDGDPEPRRLAEPGAVLLRANGVAKSYPLYERPTDRLRELLSFGRKRALHTDFWALRGVDLEVRQGEALGIIGANGAGKSTLLRILAGMSPSTQGRVEVRGRVSALLELGLGFHPDFTGRENARLALGLLGLSGKAVESKIDSVASFAEIGEFFDRRLRTYSSGMAMRLGFSVAISTDPEVLLVDEVFAVGDRYFQWKCTEKIRELLAAGRALVLVTHDTYAVNVLCRRAIWIHEGRAEMQGEAHGVVEAYRNFERTREGEARKRREAEGACGRLGPAPATIESIEVLDGEGRRRERFAAGEAFRLRIRVAACAQAQGAALGLGIFRNDGVLCFCATTDWDGVEVPSLGKPRTFEVLFPEPVLQPGLYEVSAAVLFHGGLLIWDRHDGGASFEIAGPDAVGVGRALGVCDLKRRWEIT